MEEYKKNPLEKLFERFEGQPVEIFTSDGVRYCGIVLEEYDEFVKIIDDCNRVILIPFAHIDAVIEPKMKLTPFCGEKDCRCCRRKHDVYAGSNNNNDCDECECQE